MGASEEDFTVRPDLYVTGPTVKPPSLFDTGFFCDESLNSFPYAEFIFLRSLPCIPWHCELLLAGTTSSE